MNNLTQKDLENSSSSSSESEERDTLENDSENPEEWAFRISYKNPELLLGYMSELYRILPRRFNGLSAAQQRILKREIARARYLAILPFIPTKKK